jgi:TPP-dependent pyruvate/acetoin dehydrogenase alpha subunit
VPIAVGAALAATFDESKSVAPAVFGDGAINQGGVYEAMNLAAAMDLPVIFVCENNRYSELTPIADMVANPELTKRAGALGIPAVSIDGNDVGQVRSAVTLSRCHAVTLARANAAAGRGPTFVEAHTQRIVGHYIGDAEHYRPPGEKESDAVAEPIARLTRELRASDVTEEQITAQHDRARDEIASASAAALGDPPVDISTVKEHLYA